MSKDCSERGGKVMRYFITGIEGFLGSHLANSLYAHGHDVFGLDNHSHSCGQKLSKGIRVYYGDIRYYQDIEEYIKNCDICYHTAAQINVDRSIAYPEETIDVNLMGTLNILEACRKYHKKMVFCSSSEIYGGQKNPINESSPTYSQSPYSTSKLAADKLCGNFHDLYRVEVWRVRCFNIFGPFQNSDECGAVIPIFVKRVLEEKPPIIFGDGKQRRDYLYIDDAVKAYEMMPQIKDLCGTSVNIGSGRSVSVNEIAKLIIDEVNYKVRSKHGKARPGEVSKLEADISFIEKYGWHPEVSFKDGLKKYIRWYKEEKCLK